MLDPPAPQVHQVSQRKRSHPCIPHGGRGENAGNRKKKKKKKTPKTKKKKNNFKRKIPKKKKGGGKKEQNPVEVKKQKPI